MERVNLLISDLDGTLLGDDRSLELFASWYANSRRYYRLVYSSGRFVDSVLESIESSKLPVPDAIIGGLGTQIYDVTKARYHSMWPPMVIEWNPYIVQSIGEEFAELRLQPAGFISRHKVSFYGSDLDEAFLQHFAEQMAAGGQRVSVIYSSERDLDVLPLNSNKGVAAIYLARHWRIHAERTLVAGDSANDVDMFYAGFKGIVVGNGSPELRSLDSPTVYVAEECYAAGVLEGIRFWHADSFGTGYEQTE